MDYKIFAVMPVYNQEKVVGGVIRKTKRYVDEVIAVIDGSVDNSLGEAKDAGAVVIKNGKNMGLGFTLRRGINDAIRRGADVIVTIDSDGQHDPSEIPKLVEALIKNRVDVVIGSRPHDRNMPLIKKFGNDMLFIISNLLFGVSIKDTQSGFKAFTPDAFRSMEWKSDRYSICSEIVMRIGKSKLKYREIPIKTIYETGHETGLKDIVDGLKTGLDMLRWKLYG